MKTYPVFNENETQLLGFEVENAYNGPTAVTRLLQGIDDVTDVQQRKLFAKVADIHVEFKYRGVPYIVWEPFGDNSRYWIGPGDQAVGDTCAADISDLQDEFKLYTPSIAQAFFGDFLSLRFFTRFFNPSEK